MKQTSCIPKPGDRVQVLDKSLTRYTRGIVVSDEYAQNYWVAQMCYGTLVPLASDKLWVVWDDDPGIAPNGLRCCRWVYVSNLRLLSSSVLANELKKD